MNPTYIIFWVAVTVGVSAVILSVFKHFNGERSHYEVDEDVSCGDDRGTSYDTTDSFHVDNIFHND